MELRPKTSSIVHEFVEGNRIAREYCNSLKMNKLHLVKGSEPGADCIRCAVALFAEKD